MRFLKAIDSRGLRASIVIFSQILAFILLCRIGWKTTDDTTSVIIPFLPVVHHAKPPPPPPPHPTPPEKRNSSPSVALSEISVPPPAFVASINNSQNVKTLIPSIEFNSSLPLQPTENRQRQGLLIPELSPADSQSLTLGKLPDDEGLFGINVPSSEHILVVLDVSGSMTRRDANIEAEIKANFPFAMIVDSHSAYGKFDLETIQDCNCDLYEAAKRGLDQDPTFTSVYLFTDFEDGDNKEDTKSFIKFLDNKKIKLFIRSVECEAYVGLSEYANQSGGQYECSPPDSEKQPTVSP